MPVVSDSTALQGGSYWNGIEVTGRPVIVTYSFPSAPPGYIGGVEGFTAATVSSFQAFTPAMQAQARTALAAWAAACGLVFLEVAPGQGDINFQLVDFNTTSGPSYAGSGGIAFYPFGNWNFFTYPFFTTSLDASGDVFMNTQYVSAGLVNDGTLLHEIGHAIGLKHPTEVVFNGASGTLHDQVLAADDPSLTIMATVGEAGGGTPTLKPLDRAAAAALYGPAGTGGVHTTSAAGANSVSTWLFDAPSQTVTQTGFGTDDGIRGTSVADLINGLEGADTLSGLAGNDTLNGGAGNDRLFGGQGVNQLAGGQGDDFYLLENATDSVIENLNEGYDNVIVAFSYTLTANVEQLQLFGSGLTGTGNALANTIYGDGTGANTLLGLAGNDYMVGGAADDLLNGGTEADAMYGQKGNDSYVVDNTGDFVGEGANEGIDRVTSTISYTLTSNVENLTLGGTAAINGTGNGLDNVLTGNSGANKLNGAAGNDRLIGAGGNDSLNGGSGADTLLGGAGNDTYVVDNTGDLVTENANEGTDLVQSSVTWTLAANLEKLTLTGSGAIAGTGNTLANTLVGNSGANVLDGGDAHDTLNGGSGNDRLLGGLGNDSLSGGSGNDTMLGGAGDDTYVVDSTNDVITENAAEGTDLVKSSATFTLAANIEKLTLSGSGAISATGNTLANTLTGNTGANRLTGGAGNDSLIGGSGNDTLNGGFGNDLLTGGTGGTNSDRFVFGAELNDGIAETDTLTDFTNAVDLLQVGIVGGSFASNIVSLGANQYGIDWDGIGTGLAYQDIIKSNVALGAANFLFG